MKSADLPASFAQFETLYRVLDANSIPAMQAVYDDAVVFIDPVHQIRGLDALQAYTGKLLAHVKACGFDCQRWIVDGDDAVVQWVMHLQHASLRGGAPIALKGVSRLHRNAQGKIDEHEDFYDLGAMVYEHVPVLGALIRGVKHRLAGAA
ncbi:MAG TPA: nuclear transport factor 2 family protein [Pseudomonadales bacterium]